MNRNIYELFSQRFQAGSTFIRLPSGEDLYSYSDLERLSAQYANYFAELGLSKGDRVMVQVEKSPESLMIYFACLRYGLVYLPLNTAYRQQEIEYFISDAAPSLIVCSPEFEPVFNQITREKVRTMDSRGKGSVTEAKAMDPARGTTSCAWDDVAAILYTSGTTGKPKGAMITHGNLAANGLALHKAWGWTDGDVMLHALPIFHIHGLFVGTHLPVLNASPIVFMERFEAESVIQALPASTVYMGVPTNYTRLLANESLDQDICRNMRLFTSGSAPLLPRTFHEFRERTGHTIVERYGMTETGMNTSNPLNGPRKPGTVGPVLDGVTARIVDDENNDVGPGVTGNLQIRGNNVFKGYWGMPEKTAEVFTEDGFFKTGDLASRDEDHYIAIVGRDKDLIITGGLNVYPKEIETIIDDLPGVSESAIIGVPDNDFGEAVTAVVVPDRADTLTGEDIIDAVRNRLANFKVPKQVYFVDQLPRNTMGKVQKNILREQLTGKE